MTNTEALFLSGALIKSAARGDFAIKAFKSLGVGAEKGLSEPNVLRTLRKQPIPGVSDSDLTDGRRYAAGALRALRNVKAASGTMSLLNRGFNAVGAEASRLPEEGLMSKILIGAQRPIGPAFNAGDGQIENSFAGLGKQVTKRVGTGVGATAGLAGLIALLQSQHKQADDHTRRNTALGALAGETVGAVGGGAAGVNIADKLSRNPDWETRALGRIETSISPKLDLGVARLLSQGKGGFAGALAGGAAGMVGGGMLAHRMSQQPAPSKLQEFLNLLQSRKH